MAEGCGPGGRAGQGGGGEWVRAGWWANEAERVRVYRQRKAEEQADVDQLRVERRQLRRQLSDAVRGRTRAEAAAERAESRAESLTSEVERLRTRGERDRATIERLSHELERERLSHRAAPQPAEVMGEPTKLNRAQRRRQSRKP